MFHCFYVFHLKIKDCVNVFILNDRREVPTFFHSMYLVYDRNMYLQVGKIKILQYQRPEFVLLKLENLGIICMRRRGYR